MNLFSVNLDKKPLSQQIWFSTRVSLEEDELVLEEKQFSNGNKVAFESLEVGFV